MLLEVVTYRVDKDAKLSDKTTKVIQDNEIDFNVTINSKALIKYKLDGSVIDTIEIVKADALDRNDNGTPEENVDIKSVSTESSKFEIAKDAPIFNIKPGLAAEDIKRKKTIQL